MTREETRWYVLGSVYPNQIEVEISVAAIAGATGVDDAIVTSILKEMVESKEIAIKQDGAFVTPSVPALWNHIEDGVIILCQTVDGRELCRKQYYREINGYPIYMGPTSIKTSDGTIKRFIPTSPLTE